VTGYILIAVFFCLFLYVWPSKRREPSTSIPRPPIRSCRSPVSADSERIKAAVHEAGHAIVANRCTRVMKIGDIRLGDGDGGIQYDARLFDGKAEIQMVIGLAGPAAEIMHYGSFHGQSCRSDLLFSRDYASLADVKRFDAPAHPAPKFLKTAFAVPLTEQEELAMHYAYSMARDILQREQERHGKLVNALLTCGGFSESQTRAWFGNRGFTKLMLFTKRLFV
jgi:hypothetical protein